MPGLCPPRLPRLVSLRTDYSTLAAKSPRSLPMQLDAPVQHFHSICSQGSMVVKSTLHTLSHSSPTWSACVQRPKPRHEASRVEG